MDASKAYPLTPTAFTPLTALGIPAAAVLEDFSGEDCRDPKQWIRYPLDGTQSDAEQIVTILARLAVAYGKNPCVISFARCLVKDLTINNDWRGQFDAVSAFLLDRVVYQADPRGLEYVRSPVQMLVEFEVQGHCRGDCDDMVLLFNSLLNALGFRTRVEAVMINSDTVFDHVISSVNLGGTWAEFDGCNKNAPWTVYAGGRVAADS